MEASRRISVQPTIELTRLFLLQLGVTLVVIGFPLPALWVVSAVATALLAFDAPAKAPVFAVALLLYPAWVWASAWWLSHAR